MGTVSALVFPKLSPSGRNMDKTMS